jgi:hypothetical protein
MRQRCVARVVGLVVLMGLLHCSAYGQDQDPYVQSQVLILLTAQADDAIRANADALMERRDYQEAMNTCFERAKKWKEIEAQVCQRFLDQPSVSMSLLWEAALSRTQLWLCTTREAMYRFRGVETSATYDRNMAVSRTQQYDAAMTSAGSNRRGGL